MKKTLITLTSLLIAFTSTQSLADNNSRRQPPPEAFEACEDKSEGDTVSITTPHGDTLDATCQLMQDQLVAVPERGHAPRSERSNER